MLLEILIYVLKNKDAEWSYTETKDLLGHILITLFHVH